MKKGFIIILIFIFAVVGYLMFDVYMRNVFAIIAREQCNKILNECLNEAAYAIIKQGVSYEDLINIKLDDKGNVVLVQADSMKMNILGSQVGDLAEDKLNIQSQTGVKVPFGYFVGGQLFGNTLPEIMLHFRQIGNITAGFTSEFKSAGINQTTHVVNMTVEAEALVMIPNYNEKIKAEITLPVCETIIVGSVPQDYLNFMNQLQ